MKRNVYNRKLDYFLNSLQTGILQNLLSVKAECFWWWCGGNMHECYFGYCVSSWIFCRCGSSEIGYASAFRYKKTRFLLVWRLDKVLSTQYLVSVITCGYLFLMGMPRNLPPLHLLAEDYPTFETLCLKIISRWQTTPKLITRFITVKHSTVYKCYGW